MQKNQKFLANCVHKTPCYTTAAHVCTTHIRRKHIWVWRKNKFGKFQGWNLNPPPPTTTLALSHCGNLSFEIVTVLYFGRQSQCSIKMSQCGKNVTRYNITENCYNGQLEFTATI